jgi:hypothetical protein
MVMQAVGLGLSGNEISKKITGTDVVSAGRTVVATGTGAILGTLATEGVVIGATAVGLGGLAAAAAPVVIPLGVASALVSLVASLFD